MEGLREQLERAAERAAVNDEAEGLEDAADFPSWAPPAGWRPPIVDDAGTLIPPEEW